MQGRSRNSDVAKTPSKILRFSAIVAILVFIVIAGLIFQRKVGDGEIRVRATLERAQQIRQESEDPTGEHIESISKVETEISIHTDISTEESTDEEGESTDFAQPQVQ